MIHNGFHFPRCIRVCRARNGKASRKNHKHKQMLMAYWMLGHKMKMAWRKWNGFGCRLTFSKNEQMQQRKHSERFIIHKFQTRKKLWGEKVIEFWTELDWKCIWVILLIIIARHRSPYSNGLMGNGQNRNQRDKLDPKFEQHQKRRRGETSVWTYAIWPDVWPSSYGG